MSKILIVEDESIVALELESRLIDLGYSVCGIVSSGADAINITASQIPDLILMDINIKGPIDGVETAEKIKGTIDIPIIFLTAFTDSNTLQRAKITEPYGYIVKPFEERELHTSIEIALYKHNMEKKLRDNEKRLSITLNSIADAVIATDNKGNINYMNPAAINLTSCNCNESIGKYILDAFNINNKETYNAADNAIKEIMANGYTNNFPSNITISYVGNEFSIVESSISSIKDEKSNVDGIVIVFHDVTEKSIAENALLDSERKYKEVVENASELIFGLDISWGYKYANAAALKVSEFSEKELLNVKFLDLVLPEYRNLCKYKFIKQYLSKEKTTYIEYPFKTKSGKIIWFAQSTNTIVEDGRITGFDAVARDITEKKMAEKKLSERNEFIEMVLKNIQTGLVVCSIETNEIILSNNKFEELFGYSRDQAISFNQLTDKTILNINQRENLKQILSNDIKLNDHSKLKCNNIEILTSEGIRKFISCSIIPLYDQNIFIASIEDITFMKRAEEQILKLSRAVEQSPVSVIITSVEGKIEYVNPKFEEVTGYQLKEVAGKNPGILSSGLKRPLEYEKLWNTICKGNDWIGEFQNKKKSGEFYWVSALISPIKDSDGRIIYYLALEEDITERKKVEFELIRSKEKAEEMNRLKSVFLANMSHELRTPMVGILGFAQILKDQLSGTDNSEMAELLVKSGKRLLTTLESILEFSQLESKQVYINNVQIDIAEKVNALVNNFADQLNEKKLNLKLDFKCKNLSVLVDDRLFSQALNNIIDNAIKFTSKGAVAIETDRVLERNVLYGAIRISDTGIGISQEKQKVIFEDFRQASEGKSRSFEGNGLGLTVAKKIIEMLNGYITVESELGMGSQFTLYLPAVCVDSTKSGKILSSNSGNNNNKKDKDENHLPEILLVEDNEMNKEVVKIYLKNICKVAYAKDDKSALQLSAQKKYSIVLMDINLGNGLSGIEVMRKIKAMNDYEDVPFVAITGYALHGDKEKLLDEGCSYYLSKPFMKKDLIDLVEKLLNETNKLNAN
ncbi:MAG: PAS domain S-box protein [Ignavibacteriaceae bacterium]